MELTKEAEQTDKEYLELLGVNSVFEAKVLQLLGKIEENMRK